MTHLRSFEMTSARNKIPNIQLQRPEEVGFGIRPIVLKGGRGKAERSVRLDQCFVEFQRLLRRRPAFSQRYLRGHAGVGPHQVTDSNTRPGRRHYRISRQSAFETLNCR